MLATGGAIDMEGKHLPCNQLSDTGKSRATVW